MRIPARLIAVSAVALALVAGAPAGASPRSPAAASASAVSPRATSAVATSSVAVSAAVPAGQVSASAVPRGPSRILLTPGRNTATTQRIAWTMGQKTDGMRVQYRVAGQWSIRSVAPSRRPAIRKKFSGTRAPRYLATLAGLTPGTRYSYRIVTRYGITSWYTFATERPKATSVTFIGLGDMQNANRKVPKATVRRALAAAPKAVAVLQAGDTINNPTKDGEWAALFSAIGGSGRTRDWVVSIGNHERCLLIKCTSGNAQAFRNYFAYSANGFPGQEPTWYYVDYPGVRVVVLDSFAATAATRQAAFLDAALTSNKRSFSIVLMHAPVFTSVAARPRLPAMRTIQKVIEKHNVDLVLTGHDHTYARGSRSPNRTVYVTSVSGPKYYPVTDAGWRAARARRTVWAQSTSTYQIITVSGRKLSYKAFVSHRGRGSTSPFGPGGLLDKLLIDKTRPGDKIVR